MSKTLRRRCAETVNLIQQELRKGGNPAAVLEAFVIAEIGRRASTKFDQSSPLCLYFDSATDRNEFIAAVQQINSNMTMRKMP